MLHRRRGGIRSPPKVGGGLAAGRLRSGHDLDETDAAGPGARGRRDRLRRALRRAQQPVEGHGIDHDPDALAVGFAVLSTAPIALRRSAPFAVLLATAAGIVLPALFGYAVAASGLGPVFATTSAAYLTDRRGAILAGGTFAVAAVGSTAVALHGEPGAGVQVITTIILAVLATIIGDVLRTLHERNRELEALRAIETREAVAQDRVRIARELHDVVGHALAGDRAAGPRRHAASSSAIPRARRRRSTRSTSWRRGR